jgi:hypothetical protein
MTISSFAERRCARSQLKSIQHAIESWPRKVNPEEMIEPLKVRFQDKNDGYAYFMENHYLSVNARPLITHTQIYSLYVPLRHDLAETSDPVVYFVTSADIRHSKIGTATAGICEMTCIPSQNRDPDRALT